jgi:hypothetical protein
MKTLFETLLIFTKLAIATFGILTLTKAVLYLQQTG